MSNVTRMPNVAQQSWPQQNWSGAWPPSCSCGCNPCQCGGGWGGMGGLMQCWQDIAQFQQFLICMLSQAGPVPLQGVTDGSDAKAGYIGEFARFVSSTLTIPMAANSQTVSIGVLSPGDWNCWAFTSNMNVHDAQIALSPMPAGFSDPMFIFTGTAGEIVTLVAPMARASITVPTLIPILLSTNQAAAFTAASSCTITFCARRVR